MWGISREIIVRCVFPTITNEHLDKIITLGNNYHLDDENFSSIGETFEINMWKRSELFYKKAYK